jgi:hypothetical protein
MIAGRYQPLEPAKTGMPRFTLKGKAKLDRLGDPSLSRPAEFDEDTDSVATLAASLRAAAARPRE